MVVIEGCCGDLSGCEPWSKVEVKEECWSRLRRIVEARKDASMTKMLFVEDLG